jgi:hypothetical protein
MTVSESEVRVISSGCSGGVSIAALHWQIADSYAYLADNDERACGKVLLNLPEVGQEYLRERVGSLVDASKQDDTGREDRSVGQQLPAVGVGRHQDSVLLHSRRHVLFVGLAAIPSS